MSQIVRNVTLAILVVSISVPGLVTIHAGGSQSPVGTWTTKAPIPTARIEPASGVVNGKLYVAGGEDGTNSLSVLEVYDPVSDTWATKAPMPTARLAAASAGINGLFYVAGGSTLTTVIPGTLEAYDPAADTWTAKAAMPVTEVAPASASIGGKFYVVGGISQFVINNPRNGVLQVYDPVTDTWTTKASMPTARAGAAAAEINGKLYVVGGTTNAGTTGVLEVYDPSTDTWTSKAPMPTPRWVFAGAAVNGLLYAIGGDPGNGSPDTAANEVYDPVTDTWATDAPMPTERFGMASGVINGAVYAVSGGSGFGNGMPQSVTEAFSPADTTPPTISDASASPSVLWPPNHKMRDVVINYNATDDGDPVNCVLSITSNEGTSADWQIIDTHHVRLRAERAGSGNGRVYTIMITCSDSSNNTSSKAVVVTVPHDQS